MEREIIKGMTLTIYHASDYIEHAPIEERIEFINKTKEHVMKEFEKTNLKISKDQIYVLYNPVFGTLTKRGE